MRDEHSHPGKPKKGPNRPKREGAPREGQNPYCKYHENREEGNENTGKVLRERAWRETEGAGLRRRMRERD